MTTVRGGSPAASAPGIGPASVQASGGAVASTKGVGAGVGDADAAGVGDGDGGGLPVIGGGVTGTNCWLGEGVAQGLGV